MDFGLQMAALSAKDPLQKGGGLEDAPGRWVVGAKGKYPPVHNADSMKWLASIATR
jgi:hypothetical protein